MLINSKIGNILKDTPELLNYELSEGELVPYKGRIYCWLTISSDGSIILPESTASLLQLNVGMELLSIRSSDIAFTMGAKGPLLQKASNYKGVIEEY